MSSNRRSFLQMAGAVPALAASALAVPRDVSAAATDDATLMYSSFRPCVGDEFVFEKDAFEQCVTKLRAVEGSADADAVAREGRFSLFFDAPAGLGHGTYRVSHARLGRFVLFVSPSGGAPGRVEAVFNRL